MEKRPQISFSFEVADCPNDYTHTKILGLHISGEVVPDGRNPVEYLCERLVSELRRVVPGFEG